MAFLQGNTYELEVQVRTAEGEIVEAGDVESVQFVLGKVEKYYGGAEGTVEYDDDRQVFLVPLTQQETFAFSGSIKWQVRVMYKDGSVDGTVPKAENVLGSITKTVLEMGSKQEEQEQEEDI